MNKNIMSKLFLLSRDEWSKIPDQYKIPVDNGINQWMWLRSKYSDCGITNYADCVKKIGNEIYFGNPITHQGCGVRPGIRLYKDIDQSMEVGHIVEFGYDIDGNLIKWICIDTSGDSYLLVSKDILDYSEFGDSTDYLTSKVRSLLDDIYDIVLGDEYIDRYVKRISDKELMND